jgi:hypothetical protein
MDQTAHDPGSLAQLTESLERDAAEEIRRAGFASPSIAPWSFYRPQLVTSLYSPVLQFAESEDVFPSAFNIWTSIDDEVAGDARYSNGKAEAREAALFDAYRRKFGADKHPEIHISWLSFPARGLSRSGFITRSIAARATTSTTASTYSSKSTSSEALFGRSSAPLTVSSHPTTFTG